MFKLREYQQQASDRAVNFFNSKTNKNSIIVLPTGSGKSLFIAKTQI
ncbi:MAG: DEAD/DEAH box helicase family protein [Bacteroidota bacterium]